MEEKKKKESEIIGEYPSVAYRLESEMSISRRIDERRSMSSELEQPTKYTDVQSGTSVNPIRRSSIASAAICSSLAPSLASAFPGVPSNFLPNSQENNSFALRRSATISNISYNERDDNRLEDVKIEDTINNGKNGNGGKRKLKLPFFHLQIPETGWDIDLGYHHHHHYHHHVFPHIHVPVITFTAPTNDGTGRKFNFGIRKHSQTVSHFSRRQFEAHARVFSRCILLAQLHFTSFFYCSSDFFSSFFFSFLFFFFCFLSNSFHSFRVRSLDVSSFPFSVFLLFYLFFFWFHYFVFYFFYFCFIFLFFSFLAVTPTEEGIREVVYY